MLTDFRVFTGLKGFRTSQKAENQSGSPVFSHHPKPSLIIRKKKRKKKSNTFMHMRKEIRFNFEIVGIVLSEPFCYDVISIGNVFLT